ncbi:MAG: hypothetical protein MZU91_06945 [Desulfosudis oleivorans]|nr:hypothetical protein [Desulfosudis oleivorans]
MVCVPVVKRGPHVAQEADPVRIEVVAGVLPGVSRSTRTSFEDGSGVGIEIKAIVGGIIENGRPDVVQPKRRCWGRYNERCCFGRR